MVSTSTHPTWPAVSIGGLTTYSTKSTCSEYKSSHHPFIHDGLQWISRFHQTQPPWTAVSIGAFFSLRYLCRGFATHLPLYACSECRKLSSVDDFFHPLGPFMCKWMSGCSPAVLSHCSFLLLWNKSIFVCVEFRIVAIVLSPPSFWYKFYFIMCSNVHRLCRQSYLVQPSFSCLH